jgi:hypothetical protein
MGVVLIHADKRTDMTKLMVHMKTVLERLECNRMLKIVHIYFGAHL